jgi:hypothetical protein
MVDDVVALMESLKIATAVAADFPIFPMSRPFQRR